jgi:hypothetical protein
MFNDPNKWYQGCPPLEVTIEPSGLLVYRIVESDPPASHDFLTHFELGKPLPRKADQCRWRAISVYLDLDDARKTANFLKGKKSISVLHIAQGILEPEHGVVLHTPSNENSHYSWWPCDNIDRGQPFVVVEHV